MQKVVILGSTGSLGMQTLEILEKHRGYFEVIGLAANTNEALLKKQAAKFKVKNVALSSRAKQSALTKLATLKEADIIVNVLPGIAGVTPSLTALKAGKTLLLGNKESLFVQGEKIMKLAGAMFPNPGLPIKHHPLPRLIPLDSEHNAIFEILRKVYGEAAAKKLPRPRIKKIIIPCSGGPFYGLSKELLAQVTPEQAIRHPRYKMGKKISVESATLINKGLEIIEARHLFGLPLSKITTVFHPECEIHGAVEFFHSKPARIFSDAKTAKLSRISDSSTTTYAYFSNPDMRTHIENAFVEAMVDSTIPAAAATGFNIKVLSTHAAKALQPLIPGPLSGMKIILNTYKKFKNDPGKLKNFLLHEERTISHFLDGHIKFPEIFNKLGCFTGIKSSKKKHYS